jgi:hypothetical protein
MDTDVQKPEEQPRPSASLYMEWEDAMCRAKALFLAIAEMSQDSGRDAVVQLAYLGADIIEDQLKLYEQEHEEELKKAKEGGQ